MTKLKFPEVIVILPMICYFGRVSIKSRTPAGQCVSYPKVEMIAGQNDSDSYQVVAMVLGSESLFNPI